MIREVWNSNAPVSGEAVGELRYYEPDYSKYAALTGADSYTRVIRDGQAYVPIQGPSGSRSLCWASTLGSLGKTPGWTGSCWAGITMRC